MHAIGGMRYAWVWVCMREHLTDLRMLDLWKFDFGSVLAFCECIPFIFPTVVPMQ